MKHNFAYFTETIKRIEIEHRKEIIDQKVYYEEEVFKTQETVN